MDSHKACRHLRMADATDRAAVLAEYTKWLVEYRNSSEETVRKHRRYLTLFLEFLATGQQGTVLAELGHHQVEAFFLRYSSTRGAASRAQMRAVLGVFLSFCYSTGYTRDLSGAVPTMHSYRLATVPRGISEDDIRQLRHVHRPHHGPWPSRLRNDPNVPPARRPLEAGPHVAAARCRLEE